MCTNREQFPRSITKLKSQVQPLCSGCSFCPGDLKGMGAFHPFPLHPWTGVKENKGVKTVQGWPYPSLENSAGTSLRITKNKEQVTHSPDFRLLLFREVEELHVLQAELGTSATLRTFPLSLEAQGGPGGRWPFRSHRAAWGFHHLIESQEAWLWPSSSPYLMWEIQKYPIILPPWLHRIDHKGESEAASAPVRSTGLCVVKNKDWGLWLPRGEGDGWGVWLPLEWISHEVYCTAQGTISSFLG